jgi:RNA polymerase sigma-70 factor, ECF subfamily
MSEDDAAILRACDLEGQTQRDFAETLNLSLPATKSQLLRARQRLRDRLTTACQVRFEPDGSVADHVPARPSIDLNFGPELVTPSSVNANCANK